MSASGLAAHPSPAELGQRYRAARSPIERSHLQVVWLLSRGRSEREVAQVTGYGRRWVGEVARRYEEAGPDGLGDRRRRNAGARPLLGPEDEAALRVALAEPPADGGLWTGPGPGGSSSTRVATERSTTSTRLPAAPASDETTLSEAVPGSPEATAPYRPPASTERAVRTFLAGYLRYLYGQGRAGSIER